MTHTTLQGALEALYGLERRKDKLGLDGTRALLAALGNPERRFRSIHVAGTNGKGSTCALVERALREAGIRTGLFTSPHLVDFRERIRVGGRWADEAWLFEQLDRIQSLPEGKDRTFFEVVTALGFLYFAEQGVEWAVVEVGLGGRLDTTNVITPAVSVITSIGLDHTEILGDTLAKIAAEKAGIVKRGVPVVVGRLPREAMEVVETVASEQGSEVRLAQPPPSPPGPARAAVARVNQPVADLVLDALLPHGVRVTEGARARGYQAARWPGRCEPSPLEPRLWWDGAHNAEGASLLASLIADRQFGTLVVAFSRDKDVREFLRPLAPRISARRLIASRSRSERALAPEAIVVAAGPDWESRTEPGVEAACRAALAQRGEVLLTGSLFAIGEAMEVFGGAPGEEL